MKTYESKVVTIQRMDEDIYKILSNFKNFSPLVQVAKIENWQADEDWCKFDVKGMGTVGLMIIEKEPSKTIKIAGDGGIPFEFYIWVQLKQVAPYDTRMKITLKAELNMMMSMMVGSKLQEGVDAMAEQIAKAFNG
jgi:carbon monoxide dehydrogenase subunit G